MKVSGKRTAQCPNWRAGDYGVAALVDLLTREPIPFRVSCVLGEGFTPHVERRDQ